MTIPVVHFRFGGTETDAIGMGRPYVVVYDGQCKVCGRLVKLLNAWDKNDEIEVIPFQNTSVLDRFPWIPSEAYAEAMQLIGPGGQTWQGAGAVERIIDIMPRGRLISWVFRIPFVRAIADRFYRWFARNRYMLGCGDHCTARLELLDYGDE